MLGTLCSKGSFTEHICCLILVTGYDITHMFLLNGLSQSYNKGLSLPSVLDLPLPLLVYHSSYNHSWQKHVLFLAMHNHSLGKPVVNASVFLQGGHHQLSRFPIISGWPLASGLGDGDSSYWDIGLWFYDRQCGLQSHQLTFSSIYLEMAVVHLFVFSR